MITALVGVLRFAVGWMLLLSGAVKLRAPKDFRRGVAAYRLIRGRTVRVVAPAVIVAELAAAAGLLSGELLSWAAALATVLGATFTTALGVVLGRRQRVDCNCFGKGETVAARTLLRAALLTCASAGLLTILWAGGPVRLWAPSAVAYALAGVAVAVLAALPGRRPDRRTGVRAGRPAGAMTTGVRPSASVSRVPELRLPRVGADGAQVTVGTAWARRAVIGIVPAGVASWKAVVAGLRRTADAHSADHVLICLGSMVKCVDWVGRDPGDLLVLCDERLSTLQAFGLKQFPVAIVVDEEGRILFYVTPDGPVDQPWSRTLEPAVRK